MGKASKKSSSSSSAAKVVADVPSKRSADKSVEKGTKLNFPEKKKKKYSEPPASASAPAASASAPAASGISIPEAETTTFPPSPISEAAETTTLLLSSGGLGLKMGKVSKKSSSSSAAKVVDDVPSMTSSEKSVEKGTKKKAKKIQNKVVADVPSKRSADKSVEKGTKLNFPEKKKKKKYSEPPVCAPASASAPAASGISIPEAETTTLPPSPISEAAETTTLPPPSPISQAAETTTLPPPPISEAAETTTLPPPSPSFGSFVFHALLNRISPGTYEASREYSLISLSTTGSLPSDEYNGWRWWVSSHLVDEYNGWLPPRDVNGVLLKDYKEGDGVPSDDDDGLSELDQEGEGDDGYQGGYQGDQGGDQGDKKLEPWDYLYSDQLYEEEDQVFQVTIDDQQHLVLKLNRLGDTCKDYFSKQLVGSCNGLICLYDEDSNVVSLYNPANKQRRTLPQPIKISGDCPRRLVAFGFDVETDDYKVVLITGLSPEFYTLVAPAECRCRVQVYNLSTDSWRLLRDISCLPGDPFLCTDQAPYLNGSCFFLAQFLHSYQTRCLPTCNRFIFSFDFTKEMVTYPIQLPDHHRDQSLFLSSVDDKMALFIKSKTPYYEDFDVWEFTNHNSSNSSENKTSWTKKHSFQLQVEKTSENIPRGISNDGVFAFLETRDSTGLGKKIKLYHMAAKEIKNNFLCCSMLMSNAFSYKPSQVVLHRKKTRQGGNGEQQQQQMPLPTNQAKFQSPMKKGSSGEGISGEGSSGEDISGEGSSGEDISSDGSR